MMVRKKIIQIAYNLESLKQGEDTSPENPVGSEINRRHRSTYALSQSTVAVGQLSR